MSNGPTRYQVGDPVVISEAALAVIADGNRSIKVNPSYSYVGRARELCEQKVKGVVSHVFLPGYEISVAFENGTSLHMKDNWIERREDPRDALQIAESMAVQIKEMLFQGKTPTDSFFLASLIGAISKAGEDRRTGPTVVIEVENGIVRVAGASGPVNIAIVDHDKEGASLSPDDIDFIVQPAPYSGSAIEVEKALQESRKGLERFLENDGPSLA